MILKTALISASPENSETLDWLQLIRSENVGPKTFLDLIGFYGSAINALEALPELAKRGGKKAIKILSRHDAEKEMERVTKIGAAIITLNDESYPKLLKEIADPPPVITVRGNLELLNKDAIAVVGARNASLNGCHFASKLAGDLGREGYIVISGLARGIDTSAHRATVETGTVAVIAGGIDNIYPKENEKLYEEIASNGAIISELAFGVVPQPKNFPQRNRIISGMSFGTVIVEAAMKSGSLITARLALEQGREVFAVPGHPADPRCHGPNKLIKDGASLVESAADVIQALNAQRREIFTDKSEPPFITPPTPLSRLGTVEGARGEVLKILSHAPTVIDDIIHATTLPVGIVMTVILELELAGKIERRSGNKVTLVGNG